MQAKIELFARLITSALLFLTTNLIAQNLLTNTPNSPVFAGPFASIEFDKASFNFGTIEEGDIVSRAFTFTNTGDAPLIISDVKGTCGCTVPKWPHEPIMPGETAFVTINFDSKNKRGSQTQRIAITANTKPSKTFIYLKGRIISRIKNNANPPANTIQTSMNGTNLSGFTIYPNPLNKILKLEMEESTFGQSANIRIYSSIGNLMDSRRIKSISGIIEFDVARYPSGTYTASVQISEHEPATRSFVITY